MGPRLFRRGNRAKEAALDGLEEWALQWGHAFSDVEIHRLVRITLRVEDCFNGATPFQTWKSLTLVCCGGWSAGT